MQSKPLERRICLLWLLAVAFFLGHSYAQHAARAAGAAVRSAIPSLHFLFYLRAWEALILGLALTPAGAGARIRP